MAVWLFLDSAPEDVFYDAQQSDPQAATVDVDETLFRPLLLKETRTLRKETRDSQE